MRYGDSFSEEGGSWGLVTTSTVSKKGYGVIEHKRLFSITLDINSSKGTALLLLLP